MRACLVSDNDLALHPQKRDGGEQGKAIEGEQGKAQGKGKFLLSAFLLLGKVGDGTDDWDSDVFFNFCRIFKGGVNEIEQDGAPESEAETEANGGEENFKEIRLEGCVWPAG